jgi:hypothetical protein
VIRVGSTCVGVVCLHLRGCAPSRAPAAAALVAELERLRRRRRSCVVVEPRLMDLAYGGVERPRSAAPRVRRVEHRDVEVVEEGLGLVVVDDDRIVSLADEARLDRVGERAGAFDAFGAELAGRLAAELLGGDRRFALGQRVDLVSDRELDVHQVERTPSCDGGRMSDY